MEERACNQLDDEKNQRDRKKRIDKPSQLSDNESPVVILSVGVKKPRKDEKERHMKRVNHAPQELPIERRIAGEEVPPNDQNDAEALGDQDPIQKWSRLSQNNYRQMERTATNLPIHTAPIYKVLQLQ